MPGIILSELGVPVRPAKPKISELLPSRAASLTTRSRSWGGWVSRSHVLGEEGLRSHLEVGLVYRSVALATLPNASPWSVVMGSV
ncbi:hypothetical protein [Streptomyces sp. BE133]|uniref:hypothetical protein n=1 Tax=Streptomyces sp. BE133 TaxID=3002523 RepID=UPI002E77734A|nr:hypothetical protein [Streptomyces sp. BE133]MEE1807259.1 hypothetical protein [Streptomyces sp. BE133]